VITRGAVPVATVDVTCEFVVIGTLKVFRVPVSRSSQLALSGRLLM